MQVWRWLQQQARVLLLLLLVLLRVLVQGQEQLRALQPLAEAPQSEQRALAESAALLQAQLLVPVLVLALRQQ